MTFLGSGKKENVHALELDVELEPLSPVIGPRTTLRNDIEQRQLSFLDVRNLETPEPVRPSSAAALFKPVTVEVMVTKQNS